MKFESLIRGNFEAADFQPIVHFGKQHCRISNMAASMIGLRSGDKVDLLIGDDMETLLISKSPSGNVVSGSGSKCMIFSCQKAVRLLNLHGKKFKCARGSSGLIFNLRMAEEGPIL